MFSKLSDWDDTIAASATPEGVSAIGVIRISGKKAIDIVSALFTSKDLKQQPSHTLHVGLLKDNDIVLDEVVVSIFKSPKSYTAEDVVEISCHGSPFVQEQVLKALIAGGARMARPGEFTQRAFLNGKLDLSQAEAVADLIASNTEATRQNALKNIRGGFSHVLRGIREQLLQFSALIELELDFSQEDVEFADRKQLYTLLYDARNKVQQLLASFHLGNVIKHGVQVAIIGKPNAGKSTLLNTLLNEERAIVSDIAGTTRDTIEETLNIKGILFRLIDTAGIREHSTDIIESIGVEKSFQKMRNADVVLYLFDVYTMNREGLEAIIGTLKKENIRFILMGNKAEAITVEMKKRFEFGEPVIFISARDKKNIDMLKEHLFKIIVNDKEFSQQTIITNVRHAAALEKVARSIQEIINGLEEKLPGDLLSPDIKRCLYYMGEITGEVTNEEQLDYIFSKFCIGK